MSADPLAELLHALADLRRFWERPDRRRRLLAELGEPVELAVLRTLAAVDACRPSPQRAAAAAASAEEACDEPGIGHVAGAMGIDGSTASRLVDQAVAAGYLLRSPGRLDRRRTRLELTGEGAKVLGRAREIQRRWLADFTAGWDEDDVRLLAGLLRRFIDDATFAEEPSA